MFSFKEQQLFQAIEKHNPEEVRQLLVEGIDINIKNEEGNTPLLCAIIEENRPIIKLLCEKRADYRPINRRYINAMSKAFYSKDLFLPDLLKFYGIPFASYAHQLTWEGDLEGLKNLPQEMCQLKDPFEDSILHYAAGAGHLPIVIELLREDETKRFEKNKEGATPFLVAAFRGQTKIVNYLLQHFPESIKDETNRGNNAFLIAASMDRSDLIQWLMTNSLVDYQKTNNFGNTALHLACWHGSSLELIQLLVKKNQQAVYQRNANGHTPLHRACWTNHFEIAQYLVEHCKADLNLKAQGKTPLHEAITGGADLKFIQYLIQAGANLYEATDNGETCLTLAIFHQSYPLVEWLLQKKHFDPNKSYHDLRPSLFYACMYSNLDIVKLLIKYGANPRLNIENVTALDAAIQYPNLSILSYLCSLPTMIPLINTKNVYGSTILDYAYFKTLSCQLLILDAFPSVNSLIDLPLVTYSAYFLFNNQLGYIDLIDQTITPLVTLDEKTLIKFHEQISALAEYKNCLSEEQLTHLSSITSHKRIPNIKVLNLLVMKLLQANYTPTVKNIALPSETAALQAEVRQISNNFLMQKGKMLPIRAVSNGCLPFLQYLDTLEKKDFASQTSSGFFKLRKKPQLPTNEPKKIYNLRKTKLMGLNLLHMASVLGYVELIEWLVREKNLDMNTLTRHATLMPINVSFCASALDLALANGHKEAVQTLLRLGAGINYNVHFDLPEGMDLTTSVIIGMHKNGEPVHYEGAIHSHAELVTAINQGIPIDLKMLRRALERNQKQFPKYKNLDPSLIFLKFIQGLTQNCVIQIAKNREHYNQKIVEKLPNELILAIEQEADEQAKIAFKK